MRTKNIVPEARLSRGNRFLNTLIILLFFSGFLLLGLKPEEKWGIIRILMTFGLPVVLHINMNILPKFFRVDRLLVSIVNALCALGVLILYSTNADRGITQAVYYVIGTAFMLFCARLVRKFSEGTWGLLSWLLLSFCIALLASPIVLGKEINGAKNWIFIANISIQPSEFVKIGLVILSAYSMARYNKVVWMGFLAAGMLLLLLQKDLGAVLLYFSTAMIMYYAANGSLRIIAGSLVAGVGTAVFAYNRFAHIKKRVAIWQNPWADYENSGYQLVQSLVAIASGNLFGVGLGLGNPSAIPIYYTDFIFSVIAEQFGILFSALVLCLYALIALRGFFIAISAQSRFHALLAIGCSSMLVVQTFVIIGGVIKLIPLTGVTMPFVSYGGSSLVSSMGLVGVLQGVGGYNKDSLDRDLRMSLEDHKSQ